MRLIFSILILLPWSLCAQKEVTRQTVEKQSVSASSLIEVNYDESKIPAYVLPELLIAKDGSKISSSKDWEKVRRPEILELFTSQVFGSIPSTAFKKTITVVKEDRTAMNGLATLTQFPHITYSRISQI